MIQPFSFHTHTNFSDGYNTLEEMVKRAVELGWQKMGISDHLIVHKNFKQSPSWNEFSAEDCPWVYKFDFKKPIEEFLIHKDNIRKLEKKYSIKLYAGAEVDFFLYDGWYEEFQEFKKMVELDYYISGNHYLSNEDDTIIYNPLSIEKYLPNKSEQIKAIQRHFVRIGKAAQSKDFSFIAHLDYMKKVPLCSDNNFILEKENLIKTIKKSGTAIELSTKGLRKVSQFYPADNLFNIAISYQIPVIISDDAHRPTELSFGFAEAEKYLTSKEYFTRYNLF